MIGPVFQARPFSLRSHPSLRFWYSFRDAQTLFKDASNANRVAVDGDLVAGMADKSDGGFHLTQTASAKRPLFKPNVLNGQSVGRFDGSDDILQSVSTLGSLLFSWDNCTIFMVMKQTGSKARNCTLSWNPTGSNGVTALFSYDDSLYFDFGPLAAALGRINGSQPAGWDDAWHVVELVRSGPVASQVQVIVDGRTVLSGPMSGSLNNAGSAALQLGGNGTNFLQGDVADVAGFYTDLSPTLRRDMRRYLANQCGIVVN